ncbi:MAG: diiron oxygenase [Candidatus Sericytochromatia bacterium]|nr:diiron oxygenase [Candidatus Sericytochromatia bacterium]
MTTHLIDPQVLHRQATQRPLDVDGLPWQLGVSKDAWWGPECIGYLYHSPSYERLGDAERRAGARVTAVAKVENFIYFEEHLLGPIAQRVLDRPKRYRLPEDVAACLQDFVDEEAKHTEMFWRLLEAAEPETYASRTLQIYGRHPGARLLATALEGGPGFFVFWIWLAMLVEERSLDLYRKYHQDPRVDPLFKAVYHAHMVDETRHVSIDMHLLTHLWERAPMWQRRLNVVLLDHVAGQMTAPRVAPRVMLEAILREAPALRAHRVEFERDLASLAQNQAFQRTHFSRDAMPRTFAAMDHYPEFALARRGLPAYVRESA